MPRHSLFLVSPRQRFINYPAHSELAKMFGRRRLMVPLALPTVAALTPDSFDVRVFDEEIEGLPEGECPDLVGITTLAATCRRAFELGDRYRAQGAKVVFGGPYASYQVEEALEHGDAVVVGEAEGKWERCLADFEGGTLQRVYQADGFTEYRRQRPPRWDLVRMDRIFQVGLQASRGCPFNCEFCLVTRTFGRKMRYREIENVVEEIQASPTRYLFFVDDNLTIDKRYAKELMRAIAPLKISWGGMCSLDVADDEELLRLMADAGCFNILIGFESLNPDSLEEARKHHNERGELYQEAIRRIHAAGMHINASFVVGFDHDGLDQFDRIFDFTLENALPNVNLHLLNAPPGSETWRKLGEQGRLLACDPELGVGHFPTVQTLKVSQIDLFDRYMDTVERLYSFATIRKKAEKLFAGGAFTRAGPDLGAAMKARLSLLVLKEFVLSTDPDRRALFWFVWRLIRADRLAVDKGMGFLLSMLGYHRHVADHRRHMDEYRRMVLQYDKGPVLPKG
jgi:hypothetical protein